MRLIGLAMAAGFGLLTTVKAMPVQANFLAGRQGPDPEDYGVRCYDPGHNISVRQVVLLTAEFTGLRQATFWPAYSSHATKMAQGNGVYISGELIEK